MERLRTYLLPVLFASALLLPTVNGMLGIWEYERKDENRSVARFPALDINYLDGFPGQFEDWYNDAFSFRTPLLRVFHLVTVGVFRVSPDPKRTIIGANGQMFQGGKERDIIEGKLQLTDAQLDSLEMIWADRVAYLTAKGIRCYWFIIPIKENVYPELLPIQVRPGNRPRRAEQIMERLNGRFPGLVHDMLPALMRSKDTSELFFKLDNHWNYEAGALAAKEIYAVLSRDFTNMNRIPFESVHWVDSNRQSGFHRSVLGDDTTEDMYRYPLSNAQRARTVEKYGFAPIPTFPYPWDFENRYRIEGDSTAPRALLIRDSFTDFSRPFLVEAFSETVLIFDSWQFRANRHIVERVRPDVVVYCTLETLIEQHLGHEKEVRAGRRQDD